MGDNVNATVRQQKVKLQLHRFVKFAVPFKP